MKKTKPKASTKGSASSKLSPPRITKNKAATAAKDPVKEIEKDEELQKAIKELALADLKNPKLKKEEKLKPEIFAPVKPATIKKKKKA